MDFFYFTVVNTPTQWAYNIYICNYDASLNLQYILCLLLKLLFMHASYISNIRGCTYSHNMHIDTCTPRPSVQKRCKRCSFMDGTEKMSFKRARKENGESKKS